jgi:hypothetical protein
LVTFSTEFGIKIAFRFPQFKKNIGVRLQLRGLRPVRGWLRVTNVRFIVRNHFTKKVGYEWANASITIVAVLQTPDDSPARTPGMKGADGARLASRNRSHQGK